ncbi:unnamed protein product [Tilletia caries]|uniref:Uncharacterized protein n=1 Tax=Tilletia caries TaxID=13290 RepID=A0ABN7J6N7_9BASI|nr:unnamed protein product [Tilletia caries]
MFGSPYFFPINPFQLLSLNIPQLMWSTWRQMTIDLGPEEFGLSDTLAADLGAFVSENAHRYPTVFSSCSPRDIAKHHNSKYRMVEWAAVFHHFVPAFLYDIKAPDEVQTMVSEFIIASDAAMSDQGMTSNETDVCHGLMKLIVELRGDEEDLRDLR